ncbi:MAG: nitrous oxide reductase accessory protein NosL [Bacteroidota bacterium]
MENEKLISLARVLTIFCGLALIVVLFVPLWQIQLVAPQYPEGLVLKMYPHKLGGNVEIINGLNHYIGMKTLHDENFIEFTVLPYIVGFFVLFSFIVALINKKKWLIALFISFLLFGIVAMVDFYRWNYNYGHDLDPNAAIQVPGMSYQPPLIGYKQLLNFGAYSIPDIGGWIFIAVGILLLTALVAQAKKTRKFSRQPISHKQMAVTFSIVIALSSCTSGPDPIKLGVDACSSCRMTISDRRFGGEILTRKGRTYKFDDLQCLFQFRKENVVPSTEIKQTYFVDFQAPHEFIEAPKSFLFKSIEFRSPMGGNTAAFNTKAALIKAEQQFQGEEISWPPTEN